MASYSTLPTVLGATLTPFDSGSFSTTTTNSTHMAVYFNNMTSDNTSLGTDVTQQQPGQDGGGWRWAALEPYPQFWVAYYINRYCLRVIAAIGFPGNILSFITILRMKPQSHPSIYVAVLAVSDNFCLVMKLLLLELTRHDVGVGPYGCKLLLFIGNLTAIYANWVLVLMTVERFMAVWFPLKVASFSTKRRAAVAMAFLLLLVSVLCSVFLEIYTDKWDGGDFKCVVKEDYHDFFKYVWYWLDGVFYALLPCILLVVFNALIVLGIRKAASNQLLSEDSSSRNKHLKAQAAEKVRQQRHITMMLVIVCVTFILLIMPNCIFFIYKPYWTVTPNSADDAKRRMVEQIAFMTSDFSHAVNFFVFFISTKKFRDRFLDTICCCRKWRRRIARSSHVGQSQYSETGSIYVTSTTNSGVIPLSLRNSGRY